MQLALNTAGCVYVLVLWECMFLLRGWYSVYTAITCRGKYNLAQYSKWQHLFLTHHQNVLIHYENQNAGLISLQHKFLFEYTVTLLVYILYLMTLCNMDHGQKSKCTSIKSVFKPSSTNRGASMNLFTSNFSQLISP